MAGTFGERFEGLGGETKGNCRVNVVYVILTHSMARSSHEDEDEDGDDNYDGNDGEARTEIQLQYNRASTAPFDWLLHCKALPPKKSAKRNIGSLTSFIQS